jgi:hypothetical protein
MKTRSISITKTSAAALSAIARFRHQRRVGRAWIVGDRRISTSTIETLEQKDLVREVAFNGVPTLVLTDEAKTILAGKH